MRHGRAIPARTERDLAARSAALIFVAAGILNLVEANVPGGPSLTTAPGLAALAFGLLLYLVGPRLPLAALAALGPIGAAMIAVGMATTDGPGDGAILYIWPVFWESYFFGRRGAIGIVAWIGVVHGIALTELPHGVGYVDRWLDVVVSVGVVAFVVDLFSGRILNLLNRLEAEARVDNLTGLLNRRGFAEHAEVELARARRESRSVALVSFDLDRFKAVNDEFGHDAGDDVLVTAAARMKAETRPGDVLARMGGEEFVVLVPGGALADAESFAERVRQAVAGTERPGLPRVTLSAGVSAALAPAEVEPLMKAADRALYLAKGEGRNRTVVGAVGPDSTIVADQLQSPAVGLPVDQPRAGKVA